MRQQLYKYQPRQQKQDREDSAPRQPELTKVSSYTPGNWKSYIPHEISLSSEKRSNRTPSYHNGKTDPNYEANVEDDSRIRSILSSRKEEERKRQESAMRKVRELQDKVLPMVKANRQEEEGVWIGWQSRIEQKLLRLEGQVDNMRRQMQLELEKRVVELQNKWESRFRELGRQGGQNRE